MSNSNLSQEELQQLKDLLQKAIAHPYVSNTGFPVIQVKSGDKGLILSVEMYEVHSGGVAWVEISPDGSSQSGYQNIY